MTSEFQDPNNGEPKPGNQVGNQHVSEPYLAETLSPSTRDYNRSRWNVYLSWAAILFTTVGMFTLVFVGKQLEDADTEATQAEMMTINSQAKMMIGMKQIASAPVGAQLDAMNRGALEQRYGIVLLKNDLVGAEEAEELLHKIDELAEKQNFESSEMQKRLRKTVGQLLNEYKEEQWDSGVVAAKDRDYLIEQMGWVGELGLTPESSPNESGRKSLMAEAKSSAVAYLLVLCSMGTIGLLGIIAGILAIYFLVNRKVRTHLVDQRERSVVYLETFAIWIVLFFVVSQIGGALIVQALEINGNMARTIYQLSIFFGSLVVLLWPIKRGLTFRQVREDIGWTCRNPIKEVGAGIFAYAAMAPVIGCFLIGLVIVVAASAQADADSLAPTGAGAHPIQDQIATGDVTAWFGVFLMAVVAAPIVEETMFRGVFYRYLKDVSNQWKFVTSVVFACLMNGFIFAALHPQGLIGLPFLTLLAVGMSLARQWRGSLVASITMHAINNGLITCLMFSMF